jgi:hypothetical protein
VDTRALGAELGAAARIGQDAAPILGAMLATDAVWLGGNGGRGRQAAKGACRHGAESIRLSLNLPVQFETPWSLERTAGGSNGATIKSPVRARGEIVSMGAAAVYGTDVLFCFVRRTALSRVSDAALVETMGRFHEVADRRMPVSVIVARVLLMGFALVALAAALVRSAQ